MPARDVALATGTAAALTTALMLGDGEAYDSVVTDLPPLPVVLEDAALLFAETAWWTLAVTLGRPGGDVASFWLAARDRTIRELVLRSDLDGRDVASVVDWLGHILADPASAYIPAHDPVLHLFAAVMATAEMFAARPDCWPRFLLSREMADG